MANHYELSKSDEHKVAEDARKHFFPTKKFIKHQVQYHVLNSKSDLFEKDKKQNIKHEQNVVKNGLNIIPARDVKMR